MNEMTQIPEIRAEMLLSLLYPELEEQWIAHHDGTFYRNYNHDILELLPEENRVWLSRDSMLGLLPQGLISGEEELRKGDRGEKHDGLEQRIKVLLEAFLPFDTFSFRRSLKAERCVEELLDDKLGYILRTYFGFDLAAEKDPYVRAFAVLLPCIRHHRGDFDLIRALLASVFQCEVRMSEHRYSESDSTLAWLPEIRYELLIPDLTSAQCQDLYRDIQPLRDFLGEWFVPMDVRLNLLIRHPRPVTGQQPILDYNTLV
jgi:hypothetical protein